MDAAALQESFWAMDAAVPDAAGATDAITDAAGAAGGGSAPAGGGTEPAFTPGAGPGRRRCRVNLLAAAAKRPTPADGAAAARCDQQGCWPGLLLGVKPAAGPVFCPRRRSLPLVSRADERPAAVVRTSGGYFCCGDSDGGLGIVTRMADSE